MRIDIMFRSEYQPCFRFRTAQIMVLIILVFLGCVGKAHSGNTGTVGGHGGHTFPLILCPSSKQRIHGFAAAVTTQGNIPYIIGVRAHCKPLSFEGKWGSTNGPIRTTYQKGMTGWTNDQEISMSCPDHTWVAGLTGKTKKFGSAPVLVSLRFSCYSANAQGKRVGSPTWRTLVSDGGSSAGKLYCPGGEIANGFYGKSGAYLDGLGLNCVRSPGEKPKKTLKTPMLVSKLLSWTQGFNTHWIQTYNVPSSGPNGSSTNLMGKDLRDVFAGNAVVRNDGIACIGCHASGSNGATFTTNTTKSQACSELNDFATANKPANLKRMVQQWKQRGCP